MWKLSSYIIFLSLAGISYGQSWQWTELANMPFQTANNAVCEAFVNGQEYVYSFGGIDTSKIYSGIHNRSFKYDVLADNWVEIDTLPDAPKIASAASFVNDRIYIIGGYHVASDGSEISSEKVHIYNPSTDSYEVDGTPIPVPIDDQVQCVYKDSLIFVVTGWSNTTQVPDVQIYNPFTDQWQAGTSTTNNAFYTAFGASGHIIGDTLYYHGGATGGGFSAKRFMRKGYINPADPTDIAWELMDDAPGDPGYRAACSGKGNTIFWVGGSAVSYNYDGIAYDGSGGVDPSSRILHFNNDLYMYSDETAQPYGVMDLRGIAKLSNDRWIICGGMDTNQVVSNRTFLLENGPMGISEKEFHTFKVSDFESYLTIQSVSRAPGKLVDSQGRIVEEFEADTAFKIFRRKSLMGIYYFVQNEQQVRIVL